LLDKIFLVVDHMSCAVAFAGFDGLFSRCGRHDCRKLEDVAGQLDGSATNSSAAVDLVHAVVSQPSSIDREHWKQELATYDQYPNILTLLDLKPIMQRLPGRPERQPITRRLDKIQRLRFESAAELVDELVLCIAALASRRSDV